MRYCYSLTEGSLAHMSTRARTVALVGHSGNTGKRIVPALAAEPTINLRVLHAQAQTFHRSLPTFKRSKSTFPIPKRKRPLSKV